MGGGGGGSGLFYAINTFFHARVVLGVGKGVLFREVSSVVCIDRVYTYTQGLTFGS